MELISDPWLPFIFFVIAAIYSAAGFGGGSSYLAVLSTVIPFQTVVRPLAYLCNIVVSGWGAFQYQKRSWLKWKEVLPFLYGSVPFAFLGGWLRVSNSVYVFFLGGSLFLASLLLLLNKRIPKSKRLKAILNTRIGRVSISAIIGLVSGTVGIGGGIFLAPVLHLSDWRAPKTIAAISSSFILVNSIVGATAYFINHSVQLEFGSTAILMASVVLGAMVGVRFNFSEKGQSWIKRITGVLLLVVAIRLILTAS